ncbi:5214_t:CDS:2, partial [Diversispora eburnea]
SSIDSRADLISAIRVSSEFTDSERIILLNKDWNLTELDEWGDLPALIEQN